MSRKDKEEKKMAAPARSMNPMVIEFDNHTQRKAFNEYALENKASNDQGVKRARDLFNTHKRAKQRKPKKE